MVGSVVIRDGQKTLLLKLIRDTRALELRYKSMKITFRCVARYGLQLGRHFDINHDWGVMNQPKGAPASSHLEQLCQMFFSSNYCSWPWQCHQKTHFIVLKLAEPLQTTYASGIFRMKPIVDDSHYMCGAESFVNNYH